MITHAWKAQQRLHARFHHLSYRKRPQIAVVAVARELVGFLWAVMQEVASADAHTAQQVVVVVRREASRLEGRAWSTALCGLRLSQR